MRARILLVPLAAVAVLGVAGAVLVPMLVHPGGGHGAPLREVPGSGGGARTTGPEGSAGKPAQAPDAAPTTKPRIQRSARLSLQVGSGQLDRRVDAVLQIASAEGGFVAGTQPREPVPDGGDGRTGQVTLQVPSARFDDTLVALRRLGTTRSIQMSGVDVSAQYVDLKARLGNAQAQRDAYLALLQRAQSVPDILAVQDKLGSVTGEIEQYEGQLAALDQATTYATITVSLAEGGAAAPSGFGHALEQAGSNLGAVLQFLIVALGTVSPFLVLGGLAGGGWWVWSRRRARARGRQQGATTG